MLWARSTSSFSRVMVSGRPASTVYSVQCSRGRTASHRVSTRSICSALRVVGVPPPMYRERMVSPASFRAAAVASISVSMAST